MVMRFAAGGVLALVTGDDCLISLIARIQKVWMELSASVEEKASLAWKA